MGSIEEIKKLILRHKPIFVRQFKVSEISLFGSYVRGEFKEDSDLDILVDFSEPVGFFTFLDLEEYLQRLLGVKVDLVSKKALKPRIGAQILREAIAI